MVPLQTPKPALVTPAARVALRRILLTAAASRPVDRPGSDHLLHPPDDSSLSLRRLMRIASFPPSSAPGQPLPSPSCRRLARCVAVTLLLLVGLSPGARAGLAVAASQPPKPIAATPHILQEKPPKPIFPDTGANPAAPDPLPSSTSLMKPGWMRDATGVRPNLLLITIDTLRADHVGWSERWPQSFTPNLDAFGRHSTIFLNASSAATATRPAVASLLTGLYPGRHPVRENRDRLDASALSLGELLAEAGYLSALFSGNGLIDHDGGFAQGVPTVENFARYLGSSDTRIADRAIEWLKARPANGQPFFLWLHFMDPHGPYFSAPLAARKQVPFDDGLPDHDLPVAKGNYGRHVIPKYQMLQVPRTASAYRRRYRAEVRHTDAQIGRVLAEIDRDGLRDGTLVVLTADHGEALGEHDTFFQHGWLVHEPAARVPLALRLPGRVPEGKRIDQPVSLVDLFPTLVGGLDLDVAVDTVAPTVDASSARHRPSGGTSPRGPSLPAEGRDLAPLLGGTRLPTAPVFVASARANRLVAVREGRFKLVHTPAVSRDVYRQGPVDPPGWTLFDLEKDPGELHDLANQEPRVTERLRGMIDDWEATHLPHTKQPTTSPSTDPVLEERLRKLGYTD